MKIEICEETKLTICFIGAFALLFGVICFCTWQSYQFDHAAIKAGLHQAQALGSEKIIWVK